MSHVLYTRSLDSSVCWLESRFWEEGGYCHGGIEMDMFATWRLMCLISATSLQIDASARES
jgi:hypothetical protein